MPPKSHQEPEARKQGKQGLELEARSEESHMKYLSHDNIQLPATLTDSGSKHEPVGKEAKTPRDTRVIREGATSRP